MSHLENALLGLVAMRPMSGYDLMQLFETTAMGQFSSSPGAIYPALKRLERRGLLTSELEQPGAARPRRVYEISASGELHLDAWLRQEVTPDTLGRDPAGPILRYSLSEGRLGEVETKSFLHSFRRSATMHADALRETANELTAAGAERAVHAVEHGIAAADATLNWIDQRLAELEAGQGGDDR